LVLLHARQISPAALLDIWLLPELRGIREVDGALQVGAAESYTRIIRSPLVNRYVPALAEAARTIGAAQIQNRGTLGGNLGTASPAGDALPVMLAADAVIVTSRRTIPTSEFFLGYRNTALEPDELIVAIRFPCDGRSIKFRKVGTRQAQAISKVVMAVCLEPARVAVGSVAEIPLRAPHAEAALELGDADAAVAAIEQDIRPIDDVRSTAAYRRRVTRNVLQQLLSD
jgi:CO/xanthine dehydrogenase FAD-binding subunit